LPGQLGPDLWWGQALSTSSASQWSTPLQVLSLASAGRQVIRVHVMDDFPNEFLQIKSLSRSAQQHQHGVQSQHALTTSPRSVHS
jgi:hypothetical protein